MSRSFRTRSQMLVVLVAALVADPPAAAKPGQDRAPLTREPDIYFVPTPQEAVDIDPERVRESRANARRSGVDKLVTIRHADIFETDFSDADVVTLYLLPTLNVRLMPQLRKLRPGTRILSFDFDMEGAKPAEVFHGVTSDGDGYQIYKWVVPWQEERAPDQKTDSH